MDRTNRLPPLPESPAARRNKGPLLDVLKRVLPESGLVLEIASGTGEHGVHFAEALPRLVFQPTEMDPAALKVLRIRRDRARLRNVAPPLALDVREPYWPVAHADAVLCINMIHIAPWAAAEGLLRGAAAVLPRGGPLVLYGPFFRSDAPTAPSNTTFDLNLREIPIGAFAGSRTSLPRPPRKVSSSLCIEAAVSRQAGRTVGTGPLTSSASPRTLSRALPHSCRSPARISPLSRRVCAGEPGSGPGCAQSAASQP